MRIYPAIDIIDGACVRLVQGDYSQKTKFADDPCEIAVRWQNEGGEFIHIVDLDGARNGEMPNFDLIVRIADKLNIPIEVGGGVRNMECVEKYLDNGINRVIIGTSALSNPDFVKEAVAKYGERIVVGIDAKDGMVAVNGWEEVSTTSAIDLAKQMEKIGVKTIIYTDIATDGMLKGPNLKAMEEMTEAVSIDVVASGGVSSVDDIEKLKGTGVEGAIVGKALYTDTLCLNDAINAAE
ncbi:MAG: 1-(5-phosphoribosyl)-5-[(5-phosphoribosylamino)methylideneamino]imidazole-4-carboxamide isomerase [Monoglobaceae bacterium]